MNSFPAANYVIEVVFAIAVLATVSGALLAILTTRIIRSVCGLAICCCGLATGASACEADGSTSHSNP